jgi:nitrogen fixation protein NifX
MVDTHFMTGFLRIALPPTPTCCWRSASFLHGVGGEIVAAVASARAEVLAEMPAASVRIGDLEDLERAALAHRAQLIVANSHAARAPNACRCPCCAPASRSTTGSVAMRGPGSAIAARVRPCSISPIFSWGTTMTSLSIDPFTGSAAPAMSRTGRRLALAWSATSEAPGMLRVAFASNDRSTVNQHFGAAEGFAIYAWTASGRNWSNSSSSRRKHGRQRKPLPAKIATLAGCAAVYCLAAGASAVKQLLAAGVQPIRLDDEAAIDCLLLSRSAWRFAGRHGLGRQGDPPASGRAPASTACLPKAGTNDAGHARSPRPGGRSARWHCRGASCGGFELPWLPGAGRLRQRPRTVGAHRRSRR